MGQCLEKASKSGRMEVNSMCIGVICKSHKFTVLVFSNGRTADNT